MHYLFGVDYYPEHWPRERWAIDAGMMREMGIGIVRMAEFSWSKWEPREGEFRFEDLDAAIDVMASEGIDCILGTPSAAPPAWIIEQNPDIQPVDDRGQRKHFGGRHHDCQSNPAYREHIRRFVTAFAAHYASNPHVAGFQIDNELGNSHGNLCFCPDCEARFRVWLQEKYGTIQALNERWGTAFWSQGYNDFEQITSPKETATGHNPSQQLDWYRFCSDLVAEFHQFQADIVRRIAPGKFITHNMMGFSDKVDYFKLGEQLDFSGHDAYPGGHFHARQDGSRADINAAELDFIRATKQKPFWILEQQSGITGWEILGRTPHPGQIRLWAMQAIAHGADTVMFFRWRSCLMGTEQYWHGILPHDGIPGRYHREIAAFMHDTAPLLKAWQGSMPKNEVAILFSYDQEYAFKTQPHHPQLRYIDHLMTYYKALFARHIPADFVSEAQDWQPYKVLIAPLQFLMTRARAEKLKAFAAEGGTVVLTMRCGVKDDDNLCYGNETLPCLLSDLCGLTVSEYDCLRDTTGLIRWDGKDYECECWSDLLAPTTAEPLAAYAKEFYRDTPAITRNAYGKGTVYYVGTQMTEQLARRFLDELAANARILSLADAPEAVEAVTRANETEQYLFLLNHSAEPQSFVIDKDWRSDAGAPPKELKPYEVAMFHKPV